MAKLCGLAANPRSLAAGLNRLRAQLKLPERLSACGVEGKELTAALDGLAEAAQADLCAPSNPRPAGGGGLEESAEGAGVMEETLLSVGIDTGARVSPDRPACLGAPCDVRILGGSEFRLRKISALRRFYGHVPAPQSGGPVVEVPK